MYIYIDYVAALEAGDITFRKESPYLFSAPVYGVGIDPHAQISNPKGCRESKVKNYFVRASNVLFPEYKKKRAFGLYRLGDAEAELVPGRESPYCLRLKTHTWNGLGDMESLRQRLWAGTILPTVSYDSEQKSTHLLDVLRGLLESKKLSGWQRFILALRLVKTRH